MALTLFNTLKREPQIFEPLTPGKVGFYGCGPTVYNNAHIGNLRAYVTHDLLVKTLRRLGFEVTHVMNITDVGHLTGDDDFGDDKMVKSAGERGKSVLEVANYYTEAFFKDTERLRIDRPTVVCRATEHIADMIELIRRIEAAGFTYAAGGNLYYDVGKFPHYGELTLSRSGDSPVRSRTGQDENKRNPQDFVLWFTKSKFERQALTWDSPWGRGYPGWHLECSAMSIKYLGEQFDIHAGGIDHVPIHHTNEIAQSEAATGKRPWVRFWLHNEFLVIDKGKMSKSSGEFLTLQSLVDAGYDPLDYRYFLLGAHYRSQLQFSYEALDGARNARRSLRDRIRFLAKRASPVWMNRDVPDPDGKALQYREAFNRALEDDLSGPRALAELWGILRDPEVTAEEALASALDMDRVLSLGVREMALEGGGGGEREEIEALIAERGAAKKARDFTRADAIRDALKARGIVLEDGKDGTLWRRL
ncbi:MAG: cysteine--tRNA ligase [Treponema sp.]|jgi:cysteinyl-tRNA synthetase|nr:cysteine--tRNA ligase [Treponema sp.]